MKAEERHKLKTNELAEKLAEAPEWLKKNWSQLVGGAMMLVAVAMLAHWWFNSRLLAQKEHAVELQQQIVKVEKLQQAAVGAAQDPGKDTPAPLVGYDVTDSAQAMGRLAQKAGKSPVGMAAVLAQAQTFRSQVIYSSQPMTSEQKNQSLDQAMALYHQVLQDYPKNAMAVGQARLGLGLIAEERGQWDAARKEYQQLIAAKDLMAGTVWPAQAQARLKVLEDVKDVIEFPKAVAVPAAAPAVTEAAPASAETPAPAQPEASK